MSRIVALAGLGFFVGTTLVLAELRGIRRVPLAERLRPYAIGGMGRPGRAGMLSVESLRDVIAPLSREVGERTARLFGVSEELSIRLERIHSPLDVTAFRVRQIGLAGAALVVAALGAVVLRAPGPFVVLFAVGAPLLAFLLAERRVARASARWQRRIFLELPVVSEQLGMLLSAGYSLGAAVHRLAGRGGGACGTDLARVVRRTRQGLDEVNALREWADLADVDAVHRLVGVLALNREAGDLGRLIAEEARAVRRDAQRQLIESIERRNQQVWIPVTVAALVPGVILMAVPFIDALSLFSSSP